MTIYTTTITENTAGFCDVIDITLRLKEIIRGQVIGESKKNER
jgi:hypothetical protein